MAINEIKKSDDDELFELLTEDNLDELQYRASQSLQSIGEFARIIIKFKK